MVGNILSLIVIYLFCHPLFYDSLSGDRDLPTLMILLWVSRLLTFLMAYGQASQFHGFKRNITQKWKVTLLNKNENFRRNASACWSLDRDHAGGEAGGALAPPLFWLLAHANAFALAPPLENPLRGPCLMALSLTFWPWSCLSRI